MKRDSEALKLRTKEVALRVLRLYRSLPRTQEARILGTQLLRCSTSIGVNYRAACRGRSRAEFVAKLGIVLEKADETVFWRNSLRKKIFSRQKNCAILRRRRMDSSQFLSVPCAQRKGSAIWLLTSHFLNSYSDHRRNSKAPLVPPKPKLFDMAYSNCVLRAWLGTKSMPSVSGS
jgi:four helix bundle protein